MGKTMNPVWHSTRFWLLTVLCCVLPDADVLGLVLGIPYEHIWGHRGMTHSLAFAVLLGIIVPKLAVPTLFYWSGRYAALVIYFGFVTLSHSLMDALTDGGLGVAFFAPFDATRYFFPWRPIAVSPIGISQFFSPWGLSVLLTEGIWIGVPSCLWLGILQVVRRGVNRSK